MSDEDRHSKTEQPTSKRIEEATKKSGPPQSRDLSSVVSLFVGMLFLYSSGSFILSRLKASTRDLLSDLNPAQVTADGVYNLMLKNMLVMAEVLVPFMLAVVAAGLIGSMAQGAGLSFSGERISFKFDKLNPVNGFSRIFNKGQLVEMAKAFLKILIVGYVAYKILRDEMMTIMYLTEQDMAGIFSFVGHLSFKLVLHTAGIMLVLGVLDLIYQKWKFIEDLKMTKDEVKREAKDSDGNPEVKAKIRAIRMERAQKRMRQIIPKADVVITNPTHFAVALKYDRDRMGAPMVIAKGADHMAQLIKEIAKEFKVVIVENKPLARQLFNTVKENEEIPEGLYAAAAEVLAYVYSLKNRT